MIIRELEGYRLILASHSPRRKQLLSGLGLKFDVVTESWAEIYPPNLKGKEIALYLACEKAKKFRHKIKDNEIVITADTIVWCNNKVLDKPDDKTEAGKILREISGNTHEVITGVCLFSLKKESVFCSSTKVTFNKLTEEEIQYYIESCNPYDKAGAYGIQEWIGLAACSRIEGSFFNVMGLPSDMIYNEIQKFIADLRKHTEE